MLSVHEDHRTGSLVPGEHHESSMEPWPQSFQTQCSVSCGFKENQDCFRQVLILKWRLREAEVVTGFQLGFE